MTTKSEAASGGTTIFGLLGVAFVVLKLTHVIDWSWWWVTAPFWAPFAVVAAIMLAALLLIALGSLIVLIVKLLDGGR